MHVQEDPCGLEPFTVRPCEPDQPFDLFGWSFDPETGRCSGYAIGDGCYGNANAFATREECVDTCDAGTKSPCKQKPFAVEPCGSGEIGGVDGWSLNPATQKCERFQTRFGCPTNENFFETQAECESTCDVVATNPCRQQAFEAGPCDNGQVGGIDGWTFDGQCKHWHTRTGCPANDNFFTSEKECFKTCGDETRPCEIDDDCEGLTDDPFCGSTCGDGECLICAPLPLHSVTAMFCRLRISIFSAMSLDSYTFLFHLAVCTVPKLGPYGSACRIKSTDNLPPPRK